MKVAEKIESLIKDNFDYSFLELVNESHMHSVPQNSETHFKLVLVTSNFEGKSKVARHQSVYKLVATLMQEGLHALALHLYTPEEWDSKNQLSPSSPNCMGGSKTNS